MPDFRNVKIHLKADKFFFAGASTRTNFRSEAKLDLYSYTNPSDLHILIILFLYQPVFVQHDLPMKSRKVCIKTKSTPALLSNGTKKTTVKDPRKQGNILVSLNVSQFVRTGNIFCFRETKNASDFFQKHFVSSTNVSPFARRGNNVSATAFRNDVSSFAGALK